MRKTSQTKPTDDKDPSQAIELKNSVRPRLHPLDPLEGRVALVTGGARRICRAISAELLRAGARVVIGNLVEHDMEDTCPSSLRSANSTG
jgi:hypothetical protein